MHNPEIYSPEYYLRLADLEDRHWWHVGMRADAAALVGSLSTPRQFRRILDAGCGTGSGILWARDALGALQVAGIDIAWEALELCRRRARGCLAQASVLELPFRSEAFDLVLCQDVLQHLRTNGSDCRALVEIHRVLRPGGLLLLRSNSRLGMWQSAAAHDADFQRYTLDEVTSRVKVAGFTVLRATYANAIPAINASLGRWIRHQVRREAPPSKLYEGLPLRDRALHRPWLNHLLVWILRAEAWYLSAFSAYLPFGHSTFCLGVKPT